MSDVYQSSNAAANLTKIFDAAAEAQKTQIDLKKAIMTHQIQQKMDLEKNAAELHQANVSGIEKKQMNVDWLKGMGGEDTPAASTTNGIGDSGIATSATPDAMGGSPMSEVINPAQSPNPPMSIANPGNTGSQPVNPQPSPMTPTVQPQAQPQQPSAQYQNLGYKPMEAQDLLQQRRQAGQSPNVADAAYVQSLNKVKAGTATQGEIDMVHKMNNQTGSATPPVDNTKMTGIQKGLRNIEKAQGLPEGSMWMNPSTGDPEVSPIWQKKVEALNTAQAHYMANLQHMDEQTELLFNKALDPSVYRSGAFGDSKKVFDRGEALQSLFNAGAAQPGGLDKRQIEELTIGYQNMLSRGGNSVTQVEALMPKSIVGNANALGEWLSNNPRGADQMKFVDRVHTGIEREMKTVQAQMDRTRFQRIAAFGPWMERNPEQARNVMMSFGINPDDYAKYQEGGYKEKSAVQGGDNKSTPSYKVGDTRQTPTGTVTRQADGTWR